MLSDIMLKLSLSILFSFKDLTSEYLLFLFEGEFLALFNQYYHLINYPLFYELLKS